MICEHCAYEADAVKAGRTTHAEMDEIQADWLEWGAERAPFGHGACTGACDCQHKPVGTAEGNPRE